LSRRLQSPNALSSDIIPRPQGGALTFKSAADGRGVMGEVL
jgi:hypothetical protein